MPADIELLHLAAEHAIDYVAAVDARATAPGSDDLAALTQFDERFPDDPSDPADTLDMLATVGAPATMATTGANYFGFVNGATYPVALGASFQVAAWDQNAALPVMSPVAAAIYDVTRRWVLDALHLPPAADVAFVTGATVANASCLAAARDALLSEHGWDAQRDGLFGAPPIHVVIGEKAHSTLRKSLGLVGLGRERVTIVPADDQGRIRSDRLADAIDRQPAGAPLLVCAQAGEVNTGAFDPFDALADEVAERRGWLHIDGAFGLWALADPTRDHLVEGLHRADSWATDGHKWLNVTYDCGIAIVARSGALRRTFASVAGYLPPDIGFEAMHNTPQSSQRARQIEVWAVLRTLGRSGLAAMIQQACDAAVVIADHLDDHGFTMLNEVVLNQVLVRFHDGPTTERLIAEIQRDGRIWCGSTQWDAATAMRVSVSSWKTTVADARAAAAVIVECAERLAPA